VRARVSGVMEHAYFESLARDECCDYCAGRRPVTSLAPDLNAIYCISLQEQPHRTAKAAAQFHALGLCREVLFYRPVRGRDADRAIWDSHRAVAQDAIAKGFARILVLEDDVLFTRPREALVRRITAALRALPSTWWGLYLGHVPIQAYFLRPNLLRVRSGCTHAYIANAPLLAWLASTPPMSAEVAMSHWIGRSIDAAMSSLPEMYAMFPMIAVQRYLGESGADTGFDDQRQQGTFLEVGRWRYFFIYGAGARFAEAMAVLFSPVHRLTLEWARRRVNRLTRRTATDATA
jgi:GR25 family glycosyltransferase involved in LPS biosynthesis